MHDTHAVRVLGPPLLVLALSSSLVVACGSATRSSGFTSDDQTGTAGGGGGAAGSDSPGGPTLGGTSNDAGPPIDAAACATASAQADPIPVYLVFMFDRSGSMKYNPSPNNKWDACVAGLDQFFGDPKSAGLFASMQVFPYDNGECSTSTYQTPLVQATALPDTQGQFANALQNNGPQPNYGTPTLPAFKGAMGYAQQLKAGFTKGEHVAVVLVTDGDPNDCNSSADNVGQEAANDAQSIPTYVIGVGNEFSNLNTIAQGGGTGQAIIVDTSNPAQITSDFLKAVSQIKAASLACDYQIPSPPPGQTLDVNQVNVVYTPPSGSPQTLSYNKDCSGSGDGWHYDDPNQPTKIQMCKSSCDAAQAGGRVDVVLGCATQGGVK